MPALRNRLSAGRKNLAHFIGDCHRPPTGVPFTVGVLDLSAYHRQHDRSYNSTTTVQTVVRSRGNVLPHKMVQVVSIILSVHKKIIIVCFFASRAMAYEGEEVAEQALVHQSHRRPVWCHQSSGFPLLAIQAGAPECISRGTVFPGK